MFRKSLFPAVFGEFVNSGMMPHNAVTIPAMNVKESEGEYTMELAAPGISKELCRVQLTDEGHLSVAIETKKEEKEEGNKPRYLRREFTYTNYSQNYSLPEDVDKEEISARVENGVLTVVMPKVKKEEAKAGRQIEVA